MSSLLGHKDSVEALLAGGGQPNAKNHSGETALLLAGVEGYQDIAAVFLANEADPNTLDTEGVSPLIYATLGRVLMGTLL